MPVPTVLAALLVEVAVKGPVLAQTLGRAVVTLLDVHLAAGRGKGRQVKAAEPKGRSSDEAVTKQYSGWQWPWCQALCMRA